MFCILNALKSEAAVIEPELTYNKKASPLYNHDYLVWADVVSMHLAKTASGYVRVEHMEDKTLIEQYNGNFQVLSKQYIADELPLFGGFYAGENNYFLVYAQKNPAEDDSTEVLRVVKYDKNWNRLSDASLCGEDIYIPLDAGSLRMAEYKGYLYIRTCHEGYARSGGLHHQSNLSLQVRVADMSFVPNEHTVYRLDDDSSYTYYYSDRDTSHSFNQFIMVDDAENVVTLDQGDGNPRQAVLKIFKQKAGENVFAMDGFAYNSAAMMTFGGSIGNNLTRAAIGGLAYSEEKYFAVGTSIDQQSSDWDYTVIRNAFVSTVPRDRTNSQNAELRWLTAYPEGGNKRASNPYIVKMDKDIFLVMWEEMIEYQESDSPYQSGNMSYVLLDKTGTPISQIYTVKCKLSDCEPIAADGKAVWYESSREGIRFRQIDSMGNFTTVNVLALEGDITVEVTEDINGTIFLKWNKIPGAKRYYIQKRVIDPDDYSVRTLTVNNPNQTTYKDEINTSRIGVTYEYTVYAYNDKVWSKSSEPKYIKFTGFNNSPLKDGKKYTVNGLVYKYKKGKMTLVGKEKKTYLNVVNIPTNVSVNGKKYPVTAIAANAFVKDKQITQVVIGKNITSIGKNAFSNCKHLWKITIKSQKLQSKSIGKNAFQKMGGILGKKVYVQLPKKKYKTYQKILKSSGMQSKGVTLRFSKI